MKQTKVTEPRKAALRGPGTEPMTSRVSSLSPPSYGIELADLGRGSLPAWASAVQRKAAGSAGDGDVHEAARRGVVGVGSRLPHFDIIQRSFGTHDVANIHAHIGGAAQRASNEIGAKAYAIGSHVAFASTPDLHTAAHEAAHVMQQRAGVQLRGDVGEVGDIYERHADAVADKVVAGESAEALLGQRAAVAEPAKVALQRQHPAATVAPELDSAPTSSNEPSALIQEVLAETALYEADVERVGKERADDLRAQRNGELSRVLQDVLAETAVYEADVERVGKEGADALRAQRNGELSPILQEVLAETNLRQANVERDGPKPPPSPTHAFEQGVKQAYGPSPVVISEPNPITVQQDVKMPGTPMLNVPKIGTVDAYWRFGKNGGADYINPSVLPFANLTKPMLITTDEHGHATKAVQQFFPRWSKGASPAFRWPLVAAHLKTPTDIRLINALKAGTITPESFLETSRANIWRAWFEARVQGIPVPQASEIAHAIVQQEAKLRGEMAKSSPSVAKPGPPVAEPSVPAAKPSPPVSKPSPPVSKPSPPVSKPSPPVSKPSPSVAKPSPSVAKSSPPVAEPSLPATKPSPPVAKPSGQQVDEPSRPAATPSRPAATSSPSGTSAQADTPVGNTTVVRGDAPETPQPPAPKPKARVKISVKPGGSTPPPVATPVAEESHVPAVPKPDDGKPATPKAASKAQTHSSGALVKPKEGDKKPRNGGTDIDISGLSKGKVDISYNFNLASINTTLPILGAAGAGSGAGVFLNLGASAGLSARGSVEIPPGEDKWSAEVSGGINANARIDLKAGIQVAAGPVNAEATVSAFASINAETKCGVRVEGTGSDWKVAGRTTGIEADLSASVGVNATLSAAVPGLSVGQTWPIAGPFVLPIVHASYPIEGRGTFSLSEEIKALPGKISAGMSDVSSKIKKAVVDAADSTIDDITGLSAERAEEDARGAKGLAAYNDGFAQWKAHKSAIGLYEPGVAKAVKQDELDAINDWGSKYVALYEENQTDSNAPVESNSEQMAQYKDNARTTVKGVKDRVAAKAAEARKKDDDLIAAQGQLRTAVSELATAHGNLNYQGSKALERGVTQAALHPHFDPPNNAYLPLYKRAKALTTSQSATVAACTAAQAEVKALTATTRAGANSIKMLS